MANIIKFHADPEIIDVFPHPVSANKKLPLWFKNLPLGMSNHPAAGTVKRCIPFLEAASAGYIISFWCDVFVTVNNDNINFQYSDEKLNNFMGQHDYGQIEGHPYSDMPFGKVPMKFTNPFVVETKKGYSCLFTQPMNHLEKRWKLLDGIVDTDRYYNQVNLPFLWLAKNGEYIIQKGTPLVQVIPFKREKTKLEVGEIDVRKKLSAEGRLMSFFANKYRRLFWHKMENKDESF
tara:strand:- start:355 stop:1056 length:702 start_codon:yes stop_codon:yes gene_type:complete